MSVVEDVLIAKLFWTFAIGIMVMLGLCVWFLWTLLWAHGGVTELVGNYAESLEEHKDG